MDARLHTLTSATLAKDLDFSFRAGFHATKGPTERFLPLEPEDGGAVRRLAFAEADGMLSLVIPSTSGCGCVIQ